MGGAGRSNDWGIPLKIILTSPLTGISRQLKASLNMSDTNGWIVEVEVPCLDLLEGSPLEAWTNNFLRLVKHEEDSIYKFCNIFYIVLY